MNVDNDALLNHLVRRAEASDHQQLLLKGGSNGPCSRHSNGLLWALLLRRPARDDSERDKQIVSYARQVMGEDKYRSWKQVTVEELKAFLGFSILMGVDHLPSVNDYWSRDPLLHYAPISDRIPRWRFREISWYLHFVNNEDLSPRGDPAHDRLGKVRPLLNHLSNKFATLYDPSKHVAVDEAMIKFQGWSSLKPYMPMKPIKRVNQSVGSGRQYQWLF